MSKELIDALHHIESHLTSTVSNILEDVAKVAQDSARRTRRFKGSSGANGLRSNINILRNGALSATVLADKDYAYYVEYGNDPGGGFIYPRNVKALHFFVNGQEVFAKKVKAFGPKPFMEDALKDAERQAHDIAERHLSHLLK